MSDEVTPTACPAQGELILKGKRVHEDEHGRVSLNDIWSIAKAPETRAPKHWLGNRNVKALAQELLQKVTVGYLKAEKPIISVVHAKTGRNGGTFAHPILAAAYAGYLSPKLEIEMLDVWLRFRQGDAILADEILQRASPEDNERVAVRALGRAKRNEFTGTLKDHGVQGLGFAQCTDAVYEEVLGGPAWRLRAKRGLPRRANVRNHIDTNDLSYVMAAEVLSTDRIKDEDRQGNHECADAARRSSRFIREAIERDKKDRQRRPAK